MYILKALYVNSENVYNIGTLYSKIKRNKCSKKFPLYKIENGTKNALFFLLQTPTHHRFTFNL